MKTEKKVSIDKSLKIIEGLKLPKALGDSLMLFNCLEIDIVMAIEILMPEINIAHTRILLGGDSFRVLLSKFKRIFLYSIRDETLIKELHTVSKELECINDQRNQIFHSFWTWGEKDTVIRFKFDTRAKGKTSLFQDNSTTTVHEIKTFNQRLTTAIFSVRKLKEKTNLFLKSKSK
jgi:hypothetical protein